MRDRIRALTWVSSTALVSGMVLCPYLWTTERAFPPVPAFAFLPELPQYLCIALAGLMVLSAVVLALRPRPGLLLLIPVGIATLLVCFDVTRLQPWFYQYMLMFVALAIVDWSDIEAPRSQTALAACGFILIATYFWSGLQKANLTFAAHVFPWLIEPFGSAWVQRLQRFWFVAPVFETTVGVLLVFQRTRTWGLVGAVAMHAVILLALGPFGRHANAIVWPWNVWMPIMAFLALHRSDGPVLVRAWLSPVGRAIVILVGIMPALSFAGHWDAPLSSSLYSGTMRDGWIYLTEEGAGRLPAVFTSGNPGFAEEAPGRFRMDITRWAQWALNVPPYAEPRAYRDIMRTLEEYGVPGDQMTLLVRDRAGVTSSARTYSAVPSR